MSNQSKNGKVRLCLELKREVYDKVSYMADKLMISKNKYVNQLIIKG